MARCKSSFAAVLPLQLVLLLRLLALALVPWRTGGRNFKDSKIKKEDFQFCSIWDLLRLFIFSLVWPMVFYSHLALAIFAVGVLIIEKLKV